MWTPAALASEFGSYARDVWRVVETQYKASTMRLTDTLEEQQILEDMLEASKPRLPSSCAGLHYLLATPFRYAPYAQGSRFRRQGFTEGVFYGSETAATALAEIAFYRLMFFAQSPQAALPSNPVQHTAFSVPCRSARAIDLTRPPLAQDRLRWTNLVDYGPCQELADSARTANAEMIRYASVRDPDNGFNIALLSAAAFAQKRPKVEQSWHVLVRRHGVRAWCENPRRQLEYTTAAFSADPRLAPLTP